MFHSSDVVYTYGQIVNGTSASLALSAVMMDYWISFATSLDPNDGHGNKTRGYFKSASLNTISRPRKVLVGRNTQLKIR